MQEIKGKRVTLAGLGHFGGQVAAARWLVEQGARVLVTDRLPADKLADSIAQLKDLPIDFRLGEHRTQDFTSADLIVASPAIAPHNVYLQAARSAGVPITTEVRLFIERCPATLLGVTGTKGKSTTTALLHAMLRSRFVAHCGGNIGHSLLPELHLMTKTDLVVLELSSFMLEHLADLKWSPHVAVVTMLTADHLDWHGSLAAYRSAKANIVRFQRADDVAVLNETDGPSLELAHQTQARVVLYGVERRRPLALTLPGVHNQFNAQGALAAAQSLGVSFDEAQDAVKDFRGLPHRLELAGEVDGICFYNDSIATIPESAVAALESFPAKRVLQIVGGSEHGLPITAMCNALIEKAKAVLCIGQSGDKIADQLAESSSSVAASVYRCGDLATAVNLARQIAAPGDIVLLSPGYKSFDQFANYARRGEAFAALVAALR